MKYPAGTRVIIKKDSGSFLVSHPGKVGTIVGWSTVTPPVHLPLGLICPAYEGYRISYDDADLGTRGCLLPEDSFVVIPEGATEDQIQAMISLL